MTIGSARSAAVMRQVKTALAVAATAMALFASMPANAQGVFRGMEQGGREGSYQGNRAAGPVGGVVGGAIGAGVGGAVGAVNGVLGIPEHRHYRGHRYRCRGYYRHGRFHCYR